MGVNTLIVSDYITSLKEDTELDYIFPILLNLMGFKIITTPKDSKGQPQFGKDIIAVGNDEDGARKRFYFELKGHADRDIDDSVLMKPDGIMESLKAAKYADFNDSSISGFNDLPVKVVLVHNGILKSNTRLVFDGFIKKEFSEGNFERWDIHKLTDLFSKYLFGEYLLTDEQSVRLFKRTLVLLEAPDYNYSDFKFLIESQITKIKDVKSRSFTKFFASMNLLSVLVIHYCQENNNIAPARECVTFLVLKVWHWILENQLAKKSSVIKEFRKLVKIHFEILQEYFEKTLPTACQLDGLFSERGGPFETIGYPLRCFEYLNYLIYFFEARIYYPSFKTTNQLKTSNLRRKQKEILKNIIENNIGCQRPIVDSHLIAIVNVYIFLFKLDALDHSDKIFLDEYLVRLFNNILITYNQHKRFPELSSNVQVLIEFLTTNERPDEYQDSSSLLITILFEIAGIIDNGKIYTSFRDSFSNKINLQTAMSNLPDDELEILLFQRHLHDVYYVETSIELPEKFQDFIDNIRKKNLPPRIYKTDAAGFPFLRILAHTYYQNEQLPDEWRFYL